MIEPVEQVGTKIWWKHWGVVFLLALLAAFVIWWLIQAGPWLRQFREKRAANVLRNQIEDQRRNDKYGGKTKEETIELFILALESDNIELASKYLVIEKQEIWKKTLVEYQNCLLYTSPSPRD